jgi:AraC-like DNA-binding protein
MQYKEFLPANSLHDYIKCYWLLHSDCLQVTLQNKFPPLGCIDLLFQQTPALFFTTPSGNIQVQLPRFLVTAQTLQAFDIELNGIVKIWGVRLQSYAAQSVLGIAIPLLRNCIWPMQAVLGDAYLQMAVKLTETEEESAAISLLNDFFYTQSPKYRPLDYTIKETCQRIITGERNILIQDILATHSNTIRSVRDRFHKQVGLTPRHFTKIIALQKSLSLYRFSKAGIKSLTSLALETGYYDQAHFNKEFRLLTNMSPREYFATENTITDFFINNTSLSFLGSSC